MLLCPQHSLKVGEQISYLFQTFEIGLYFEKFTLDQFIRFTCSGYLYLSCSRLFYITKNDIVTLPVEPCISLEYFKNYIVTTNSIYYYLIQILFPMLNFLITRIIEAFIILCCRRNSNRNDETIDNTL